MRKRIWTKGVSLLLSASMIAATVGIPAYATIEDERNNLNNLQNQKQDVQSIINSLEKEKSDISVYIDKLDAEVTSISKALYKTEQDLASVEKKIKKNEKKLKAAQESITEQYAAMKLRIKFMYENGNQEMISLILSSKNIGDFLNKAEYISELSTYDRNMLDKMKQTKQTIETTQATLTEQKNTLTALKEDQQQKKSDVEALYAAKQTELAAYTAKIAQKQDALDDLEKSIGNQQAVIAEMEKIEAQRKAEAERKRKEEAARQAAEAKKAADAQRAAEAKNNSSTTTNTDTGDTSSDNSTGGSTVATGGYIWPLPGHSKISSGFGYRSDPFSGKSTYHSGIDIPAPAGTSIIAANSGEVAWSNYSSTAGNWVGIDHGNGIYTVYMHMSASLVSKGQKVSQGQTIGLVGTTGSSTGNHLHFSVRLNGSYVSPLSYVSP